MYWSAPQHEMQVEKKTHPPSDGASPSTRWWGIHEQDEYEQYKTPRADNLPEKTRQGNNHSIDYLEKFQKPTGKKCSQFIYNFFVDKCSLRL